MKNPLRKTEVYHIRVEDSDTGKKVTKLSTELTKDQRKSGDANLIPKTKQASRVARALWH